MQQNRPTAALHDADKADTASAWSDGRMTPPSLGRGSVNSWAFVDRRIVRPKMENGSGTPLETALASWRNASNMQAMQGHADSFLNRRPLLARFLPFFEHSAFLTISHNHNCQPLNHNHLQNTTCRLRQTTSTTTHHLPTYQPTNQTLTPLSINKRRDASHRSKTNDLRHHTSLSTPPTNV